MKFEQAMVLMRQGLKVKHKDNDSYLYMSIDSDRNFIYKKSKDTVMVFQYSPDPYQLMSEDWELCNE